jgi:hypothetical protein
MDMAFNEPERTDIRRFCGYPAYGLGNAGLQGWRFYQVYGVLEFRLQHLTGSEEAVVRRYLETLANLERAVPDSGSNLDTEAASVWKHNRDEVRERTSLFDDWRRRLCGFLGVPPGPALGTGGTTLVV